MKIVSHSVVSIVASSSDSITALQKEVNHLKEEVAALRVVPPTSVVPKSEQPSVLTAIIAPQTPEPIAVKPPAPRTPQDPLFAQLWAYINNEK